MLSRFFYPYVQVEQSRNVSKVARTSAISVALILITSAWVGDSILDLFGIGIPAFRAEGGLLILLMTIAMMHAKQSHAQHTPEEADEANDKESIAVVPIAIPLMAGPGAISLVIVYTHQVASWSDRLILTAGVIAVSLSVWLALHMATPIGKQLGITGLNIATRIMGLLLAAIGIQMLTSGLVKLLPGLANAAGRKRFIDSALSLFFRGVWLCRINFTGYS